MLVAGAGAEKGTGAACCASRGRRVTGLRLALLAVVFFGRGCDCWSFDAGPNDGCAPALQLDDPCVARDCQEWCARPIGVYLYAGGICVESHCQCTGCDPTACDEYCHGDSWFGLVNAHGTCEELLCRCTPVGPADADGDVRRDGDADVGEVLTDDVGGEDGDGADDAVLDTDGDGLTDEYELATGCLDPNNPDTDGDGLSDLAEVATGSDPCAPAGPCGDSPCPEPTFLVPYEADPLPASSAVVLSTNHLAVDLFLLVDVSSTMAGALAELAAHFSDTVVPLAFAAVPSAAFGAASFSDYPYDPFGSAGDVAFSPVATVADDPADVAAALRALVVLDGGDAAGSQVAALWTLAAGDPSRLEPAVVLPSCAPPASAYPCFRPGAAPLIVTVTDRPFHNGPEGSAPYPPAVGSVVPPSFEETVAALSAAGLRATGVDCGGGAASDDLGKLAVATGTADGAGVPLIGNAPPTGEGLAAAVGELVERYVVEVPARMELVLQDDPTDLVDAVAAFIDHVELLVSGESFLDPGSGELVTCPSGLVVGDRDGDGHAETVEAALPGTRLCVEVAPRRNVSVPAGRSAQAFRAFVYVHLDGREPVDRREIYFIVPAGP